MAGEAGSREAVLTDGTIDLRAERAEAATHAASLLRHALDPLLKPVSIALVGASMRADTPGNTMARAVARDGYRGRVYAVNPRYDSVEGIPCFASLAELPEPVEHVVLCLGNEALEDGLVDAARHGAKAVTIFASCNLTDAADDDLAERLARIAQETGIVICGGNGMGFCNPPLGLRVTGYTSNMPMKPGGVAFVTQSGSAFSALAANDQRLKFSLCVSSGRELTTTMADYLDWALEQPQTKVVGLFLETARQPRQFALSLEKAWRRGIPVVALKVGRTEMSAAFAASHSGAIAGDDAAYEALFDKWGVTSVDTLDQLAANLLLFSADRPAAAGGLASLHDSGGERELVTDIASRMGVRFAQISDTTLGRLRPHLDSGLQAANPLDVWGSGRDFEQHVEACMDAMLADPDTAVGALFQDIRDGSYVASGFAKALVAASRKSGKPVAIITNYASVDHRALALATTEAGVPGLDGTEEGLHAIRSLLAFRDRRAREQTYLPPVAAATRERWRERLSTGLPLDEMEGLSLLADYGIAAVPARRAESLVEALDAAQAIGFPVALKTAAPGIMHKSDRNGVRLGLADGQGVEAAYADLSDRLGRQVVVAQMALAGVEIAFGMVKDPQFGPYVMVAAGGIWIEILKDRAVALPPLSLEEAQAMIARLKIGPLLDGARGRPAADRRALVEALARFSMLVADLGEWIEQMDVNPLLVSPQGCVAVDALVIAGGGYAEGVKSGNAAKGE
jgi:acyl-CoA synthetase (NDP forming)